MCERWVGDWTDCNILTPDSSIFSSTFSRSVGLLNRGSSAGCWFSLQHLFSNSLELSVAPGYIIVWRPPASCGLHICTQFNPSTAKVIPWYLRPDAPVILHRCISYLTARKGSICYSGAKYFFLSCPRICDRGLIVVIVYYLQIWNKKKNTTLLSVELLAVILGLSILRHPIQGSFKKF